MDEATFQLKRDQIIARMREKRASLTRMPIGPLRYIPALEAPAKLLFPLIARGVAGMAISAVMSGIRRFLTRS